MDDLSMEILTELRKSITGEVKTDPITRILYSTDASIHKIQPLGVAFPRNIDEINELVRIANLYNFPLIARGSGSSLAGQSIGK
jgi:FAD/FMN-containing dehydrogenase